MEHYDVGHCGNAGLGGMFILSASCPPIGMQVEIELNIPTCEMVPRPQRLHCSGRVTRVESCYQLRGFAVVGRMQDGGPVTNALEEMAVAWCSRRSGA